MDEAFLLIQEITANIVSYCQVAMTLGGTELSSPYCCILLTPDLSEALSMPKSKEPFLRRDLSSGTNAPSLGLLIQHLKECTEGYFTALEAHQQHTKKLESGGKLSSDEMRQLLDGGVGNEKLLPSQQQSLARKRLQQLIANRKTEMQLYIIENMLYILWRHLQYYLVHCKPVDPDISLGVPGIDRAGPRRLQDSTSYSGNTTFELSSLGDGVRTSDLEDLKTNAIKCLTDGFFKKLLDLEEAQLQSKAEMRVGFVQALVRRIRRLLKLRAAAF